MAKDRTVYFIYYNKVAFFTPTNPFPLALLYRSSRIALLQKLSMRLTLRYTTYIATRTPGTYV